MATSSMDAPGAAELLCAEENRKVNFERWKKLWDTHPKTPTSEYVGLNCCNDIPVLTKNRSISSRLQASLWLKSSGHCVLRAVVSYRDILGVPVTRFSKAARRFGRKAQWGKFISHVDATYFVRMPVACPQLVDWPSGSRALWDRWIHT